MDYRSRQMSANKHLLLVLRWGGQKSQPSRRWLGESGFVTVWPGSSLPSWSSRSCSRLRYRWIENSRSTGNRFSLAWQSRAPWFLFDCSKSVVCSLAGCGCGCSLAGCGCGCGLAGCGCGSGLAGCGFGAGWWGGVPKSIAALLKKHCRGGQKKVEWRPSSGAVS